MFWNIQFVIIVTPIISICPIRSLKLLPSVHCIVNKNTSTWLNNFLTDNHSGRLFPPYFFFFDVNVWLNATNWCLSTLSYYGEEDFTNIVSNMKMFTKNIIQLFLSFAELLLISPATTIYSNTKFLIEFQIQCKWQIYCHTCVEECSFTIYVK